MENLDNIEYEFYMESHTNKNSLINIDFEKINRYCYPIIIDAVAGLKTLAKWKIKRPNNELLSKNNIDPDDYDFKNVLPIIIEDKYKSYEMYYSELEKELLKNLLSKYCELSDDKLNSIFGYKDKIKEMCERIENIAATEFALLEITYPQEDTYYIDHYPKIKFDDLINKIYSSAIINGREGELDEWESCTDNYFSVEKLLGFNREELVDYSFLYSTNIEELKGRDYIMFVIEDRVYQRGIRVKYIAPIEYPKDSDLNFIQIIKNYIYNTFYTVSEPVQRRFITFLQRYCSEKENKYVKTKSYK